MNFRKVFKQKLNKNNAGLSLVELLVAVAILAIIAAPLLHAFVTSTGTGVKSKNMALATEIGSNVMEAIESSSVQEISRYFNYPEDTGVSVGSAENPAFAYLGHSINLDDAGSVGTDSIVCELNPTITAGSIDTDGFFPVDTYARSTRASLDGAVPGTASTAKTAESGKEPEYTFTKGKKTYTYALTNVKPGTGDKTFDVLLTLNPNGKLNAVSSMAADGGKKINEMALASIAAMNSETDAVCKRSDLYTVNSSEVIAQLNDYRRARTDAAGDPDPLPDVDVADTRRDIYVVIDADPVNGKDTVKQFYRYYANDDVTEEFCAHIGGAKDDPGDVVYSQAAGSLKNVYIFVSEWSNSAQDRIFVIDNIYDRGINIYLIKQEATVENDPFAGIDPYASYNPNVYFTKPGDDIIISNGFDLNTGYRHVISIPAIEENTASYFETGIGVDRMNVADFTNNLEARDRVYDVKVEVYTGGTLLDRLKSGAGNFGPADVDDDRLLTLTGGLIE